MAVGHTYKKLKMPRKKDGQKWKWKLETESFEYLSTEKLLK